jgi:hypothetical protein
MKTGDQLEQGLRFAKSKGFGVMSNTEMDPSGANTNIDLLNKVMGPGYSIHSRRLSEHSQECPITLRKAPQVTTGRFNLTFLSRDLPGPGLGNERWLAELWFTFGKTQYVVFATHYVAAVQRTNGDMSLITGTNRWPAFQHNVERTEARVNEVISVNPDIPVVLMGDLNMMPEGEGRTNPSSPHRMFKRLGMKYVNERVIYIAYRNMHLDKQQAWKPGTPGWPADHALLKAWLTPTPRKKKT